MNSINILRTVLPAVIILSSFCPIGSAFAQKSLSPQEVDRAVKKAVNYLWEQQKPDGGWPEFQGYDLGVSCIVTLALLNAGEDVDQPSMKRALNYISSKSLDQTYTVSLQTMVMCTSAPNKYAGAIRRNVQWLIEAQCADGGWIYSRRGASGDPSNSQFALLALHEAQRVGVEIPEPILKKSFAAARVYWQKLQRPDGSFAYSGDVSSGSMTCAGIASLIIVGSQNDQLDASASEQIHCCGGDDENRRNIERALAWMGRNFRVESNPGTGGFYYYYMYGLERAGRLSGRRFFVDASGNRDWYREGVKYLVQLQNENGSVMNPGLGGAASETALALLFLAKGKRQVVINRLDYGQDDDWNHHKMSMQHLTAHTEKVWKRDLAWQTVRIKQAKVEDLLEAPVLFISGSNAPNFSRDEKLLLKRYVEQGGFIFAEACNGDGCNGAAFEDYFKRLAVELFEQPLEKLSPDHPIWNAEATVDPKDLPKDAYLYGVQSCCRLGVVYSSYSLSCRWELNLPYGNKPNYSAKVQADMDAATKIGVNVLSYASGKELKEKLSTVSVLQEVIQKTTSDRGLFVLPILQHNAGADDAPKAVKTLVEWLNQENPFQMSSEKRKISIDKDSLEPYSVVYMHGRGRLELTAAQRDALREHFQNGGSLICDAICADQQFADSFRAEMEIVLGGRPLKQLDASKHPIFSSKFYGGFDIPELSVIEPPQNGRGSGTASSNTRKLPPLIEAGFQDDGRICVLFSPLDISCALESKHSLQCRGYVREDAARLGINLILFALQQR